VKCKNESLRVETILNKSLKKIEEFGNAVFNENNQAKN
jgi:hypothetical protein